MTVDYDVMLLCYMIYMIYVILMLLLKVTWVVTYVVRGPVTSSGY